MAWTSPATWVANTVLTAAQLNTQVRDNLKAIGDPWTAYAPSWTAATSNPVISNGTIVGRHVAAGKLIHFRVVITMGSTTTFGTGQYSISLPVAAHGTGLQFLLGEATVAGGANRVVGRIAAAGTTAVLYCDATTAGNPLRAVTPTVPATFANGSVLTITGTYEAA